VASPLMVLDMWRLGHLPKQRGMSLADEPPRLASCRRTTRATSSCGKATSWQPCLRLDVSHTLGGVSSRLPCGWMGSWERPAC